MHNTKRCPIFCLDKDTKIDDFSKMIAWAYKNPQSETVLILDEATVSQYQEAGLWEIIANETQNWLFGLHEDDWIFYIDVMKNIIQAIYNNHKIIDKNIKKIIFILNYAIEHKKPVVFYL